jgi:3-hydroxyisobutyrate dehydrogenase-like beta-hydroxyacid dehydrogenase
MVQHLLGSGHNLVVSDSNRLAMTRITEVAKGSKGSLETRDLPADISSDPDISVVFTMLPTADAVRSVYLGEKGLFKASKGVMAPLYADW